MLSFAMSAAWAEDGAVCHSSAPLVSAATLQGMQGAVAWYSRVVAAGGWAVVPMHSMQVGDVSPDVKLLRARLASEGEVRADSVADDHFDESVAAALKHFQARYGLPETGILDQYTLRTMNVPAKVRLAWVQADVVKLQGLLASQVPSARAVVVNIPAAEAEAISGGVVQGRYRVVAGAPEHPSPEVQAQIFGVSYNPTWTVPADIVKNDIYQLMQEDKTFLASTGFTVTDSSGRKVNPALFDWHSDQPMHYLYRQAPGPTNALGSIRLNMPNPEEVYMHDTPKHALFDRGIRFLSAGCVRVENVAKLANWLRGGNAPLPAKAKQLNVTLAQPVPVTWVYMPAWSTPEGVTCFRPDIYKKLAAKDEVIPSPPVLRVMQDSRAP